jgi:peptidyl-prolyl cis-trans isomerase D
LVERLQNGETLAAATGDFEVKTLGLVERNASEVPAAVLELAFSMPRPGAGAPRADSAETGTGDAVVVVLTQVVDGDPAALDQAAREAEARLLSDTLARSAYEHLLDDLQSRAKIERETLPPDTVQ